MPAQARRPALLAPWAALLGEMVGVGAWSGQIVRVGEQVALHRKTQWVECHGLHSMSSENGSSWISQATSMGSACSRAMPRSLREL